MLSGKHRKFCEGIVRGLGHGEAYIAAYPNSTVVNGSRNAHRLLVKPEIQAEIAKMRAQADMAAGGTVMTLIQKRQFLARVVRANLASLDLVKDGDLLHSISPGRFGDKLTISDKLAAIREDNDLAGEGSEAGMNDEISAMMTRLNSLK